MKKIHTYLGIVLLTFISFSSYAQRIGFQVGGSLTGLQQSTAATKGDFNVLSGALAGPEMEFRLNESLGLNLAALFEFRAGRYDIGWYKTGTTFTGKLYYAQVPLQLTYRKATGKNKKLNMLYSIGPRLNVGLFGTTNEHYYLASRTQVNDSTCFAGANAMHRMDVGLDVGIGLEVQRFQFKLNYAFPLTNSANVSELTLLKQHQLQLTIGYTIKKFNKKKIRSQEPTQPAVSQ